MDDASNPQTADRKPRDYKDIRHDSLRTAIKQPLLDKVLDEKQTTPLPVILEANDEYYLGKAAAVAETRRLVQEAGGPYCGSIGSDQNPFYKARLTKEQILAIVQNDDKKAK